MGGVRIAPSYRVHAPSGNGCSWWRGKLHYHGKHGTRESIERYALFLHRVYETAPGSALTVRDLCSRYFRFALEHFRRPDGKLSTEVRDIRMSVRELSELFGETLVVDMTMATLGEVRRTMIERELSRGVVNQRLRRIKRMVRVAEREGWIPPGKYSELQAFDGLRSGFAGAIDHPAVLDVPKLWIDAVRREVSPVVRAMIDVLLFTGMRPGEVIGMRWELIDKNPDVWTYRPETHKGAWLGERKEIPIGPQAQAVLNEFRARPRTAPIFSAAESAAWWRALRRARAKCPRPECRLAPERATRLPRMPRDRFSVGSLDVAIARACLRAGVPHWHSHQLRHTAATWAHRDVGWDAAQAMLFQRTSAMTDRYSKARKLIAWKLAKERG